MKLTGPAKSRNGANEDTVFLEDHFVDSSVIEFGNIQDATSIGNSVS
jgi:hypothetical protein